MSINKKWKKIIIHLGTYKQKLSYDVVFICNNDRNNYFKPIFSSIEYNGSLSVVTDGESFSSKKQPNALKVSSKSKMDYVSEEEVDQEVEKIHEQGIKKFELIPKNCFS